MLKFATKCAPQTPALETAHHAGFRFTELWLDATVLADRQAVLLRTRHYPFGYAQELRMDVLLFDAWRRRHDLSHPAHEIGGRAEK
jgi:hypothetical protein